MKEKPSFIDYLRGGTRLNFLIAVDFTSSNKHPSFVKNLKIKFK